MTEKWDVMRVVLKGGTHVMIVVDALIGNFAIHQRVINGQVVSGVGYTVSHHPSGVAVWHVSIESDALKIAQYLNEQNVDPLNLTASQHTKLVAQLTTIAPRQPHAFDKHLR